MAYFTPIIVPIILNEFVNKIPNILVHAFPNSVVSIPINKAVANNPVVINPTPNIIIKAGPNAKWYMKKVHVDEIDNEIEKQKWRNTSRCTMFIIDWD